MTWSAPAGACRCIKQGICRLNQDRIKQRCQSMEVGEIVRALTLGQEDVSAQFRDAARRELESRGIKLSALIDTVTVAVNDGDAEQLSIDTAVSRLDADRQPWNALLFTSCVGDTLIAQSELRGRWILHAYEHERYRHSYQIDSTAGLKPLLEKFLKLTPWQTFAGEAHHLDNWKLLLASDVRETIEMVADDLDHARIPHTVQTPLFSGDTEGYLQILVPKERLDEASAVVDEADDSVYELYDRAEAAHASGDLHQELTVYDQLVDEDPENAAVFYNRANILMEITRYEEAAQMLAEAVSIGMKSVEQSTDPMDGQGGGLGGIFGVMAILFRKVTQPAPAQGQESTVRYPDFLDDAELLLEQLEQQLPDHLKLLHCLGAIARMKNDTGGAQTRYRRILELDPDDQVAYFNLGYLHSERGGSGDGD